MRVVKVDIRNFRGIRTGTILLPKNAVFVGDNNAGKSTILEALDLVLGPERLARVAVIDEHDFYGGAYVDGERNPVQIFIEVVIVDLQEEQLRHFRDHLEWWNSTDNRLIDGPPAEQTDDAQVVPALRVAFQGEYDAEEDDFVGRTVFQSPPLDKGDFQLFQKHDKRMCGFLFLRTLRTGSRALSLERGSLLDIILRLQERRLQMWEEILVQLRTLEVAVNPELGISTVLSSVQDSVRSFVHSEWANAPQMRVSDLTRESLRKILTVFMETGAVAGDVAHAAPFQHQGTGTINTLVLALLSQIAELKQNVIFAMEEPEIAIPPHAQKRIVDCVKSRSAQALFTSHSPYVVEEFDPVNVLVVQRNAGVMNAIPTILPPSVKPKTYRSEFRTRFCEALLARRVLIVEGRTEYDALPAAARRLHELHPEECKTLESLGIAIISADTDSQVAPLGAYFKSLSKQTFAIFDRQNSSGRQAIEAAVSHVYENPEHGFENLLLNQTDEVALRRIAKSIVDSGDWPQHLARQTPNDATPLLDLQQALADYLGWSKGSGSAADFVAQCTRNEMPEFIVQTLAAIQVEAEPPPTVTAQSATAESNIPLS